MKKNIYILTLMALGLTSCSVEAPFQGPDSSANGEFSRAALNLDVLVDDNIKMKSATRAGEDLIDDFDIYFINTSTSQTAKSYKYADMPEVVTLPAATYRIEAVYGEDLEAEWENPHFKGTSANFTIEADKVNTSLDPVTCSLQNVMVSVIFDPELLTHIEGEPEVEVKVNQGRSLVYTLNHSNNKTPGYFKHSEVCTLTAEFRAKVDGVDLKETKALDGIEAGNHYRLTFALHNYDSNEKGEVDSDIVIDANVTVQEVSSDIEIEEDEPLTDVTWPTEDPAENEDPNTPENPDDEPSIDEPTEPGPQINLDPSSTVKLGKDETNEIGEDIETIVVLNIHSDSGIKKFQVSVESNTLQLEELGAEGGILDLVDPGSDELLETLHGLGLLNDGVNSLYGEHDVKFDITGFMDMLMLLGEDDHLFIVTVGDDDGEKTVYLNLSYHPNN